MQSNLSAIAAWSGAALLPSHSPFHDDDLSDCGSLAVFLKQVGRYSTRPDNDQWTALMDYRGSRFKSRRDVVCFESLKREDDESSRVQLIRLLDGLHHDRQCSYSGVLKRPYQVSAGSSRA
ncbi:hypothetical protein M406DRAFT_65946 [Cryphonectria parasitica EP155]|uniref:Uncharacterized protein n=1 Tax=Cryphonectria parasitica (strain ATCC 38755 / EP155) TaxID=660469 RepID=A0A9P4YAH3_CRYP1|nr:uncharacterized protein M406DRAFT_65946 [Cryphonectria parasitica EP155]KAF3769450.1 hypothetical protein M406DRAFT_65946 [Cryphonectria parasitica EP155]